MISLSTLSLLISVMQAVLIEGNVRSPPTQLKDIVPKREVLYVGGEYTNVKASLDSHMFHADLRSQNRMMQSTLHPWLW